MMPLRLGLTGGIGSGKSTVAALLRHFGAVVVDTDHIARELAASGGAAIDALRAAFGEDVIDASGALDRGRMRAIAFADTGARRRLEAILHPLVGLETERQAAAASATAPAIVFDVPLLVESGRWAALVDRVWVVDCPESTQIARVVARSQWETAAVAAVVSQQATRRERLRHADAVIYNEDISLAALEREVRQLWDESIARAR